MSPVALLLTYCGIIVAASLAGGWIPILIRLTHKRMELAISFVAGAMLGVGMLHLLPHAWMERAEWLASRSAGAPVALPVDHALIDPILWWLLAGFLAMFFIERFFRFHHHDTPQDHTHETAGEHEHHGHGNHSHSLTWTGAAIGLTLHSLIDGIALAASVQAEARNGAGASLAGLATFVVILLHKPFDSISLGTLLAIGGKAPRARHAINGLFALAVPLGALLFHLGLGENDGQSHLLVSAALAFSAGTFLCISLSDLLPELQFHHHDRLKLSLALLAGLALAWAVSLADPHRGDDHRQQTETADERR